MTRLLHQSSRRLVVLSGLLIALVAALFLTVGSASGQTSGSTYEVTLATLGYSATTLTGPSDSIHYYFSLPANWAPQAGSSLGLNLAYAISGKTSAALAQLEVRLNGKVLRTESLSNTVVTLLKIDIPPEALYPAEDPHLNDLALSLSVRAQCEEALLTTLTVDSSSALSFVYQERPLLLDLAFYPKPLYYSRAFETTPDRIVLPSQPNNSELTSAAMIAANLGAQTYNNLPLEASLGPTLPATATQQHLMVIGSPGRATLLSGLTLPLPVHQRQIDLRSQMPAAVTSMNPFSYTLIVKNTSAASQSLTVEDRLSPPASMQACPLCSQVQPGLLRWNVGVLGAGQSVSATVQASLDPALGVSSSVEHTASLLDASGQVINVDTLTTTVALAANETMVSSSTKGPYFFSLDDQGVPENDGIVQMVVSPWNMERAIVVVTGLDDAAVLRAARALAASNKMPGMQGQYAIVQAVRPVTGALDSPAQAQPSQDVTLADLGYSDIVNVGRAAQVRLSFQVPPGAKLTEAAYLATHWAHGSALNAISGTLELSLNGTPVNSIELRPDNEGDGWTKVSLPARSLKPGVNELRLQLTAIQWPACLDDAALARFWVTVYADSYLHLPFQQAAGASVPFDLVDYPQFLVTQPSLSDVAVLFPEEVTSDEVQGMVQLLSFLGSVTRNAYFAPQVALGNQVEPDRWRDDHLIVIGRPTQNPYIPWVNDRLPQPFLPGQDEIRQQVDNVIFRWPRGFDLGYIQLLPAPWTGKRAMLVVTGTTDKGLGWSLRSLADSTLVGQLSGNLAVLINETAMRTADTRPVAERQPQTIALQLTPTFAATPEATVTPTATAMPATSELISVITPTATHTPAVIPSPAIDEATQASDQGRSFWVIPLLGLSLLVVVVAIGVVIWQARA